MKTQTRLVYQMLRDKIQDATEPQHMSKEEALEVLEELEADIAGWASCIHEELEEDSEV